MFLKSDNHLIFSSVYDKLKGEKRKANNKMSRGLLYSGKAKDLFTTEDENVIIAQYKDQATMLNGARKETVSGKGRLNNLISSFIFEKLIPFLKVGFKKL